MSKKFLKSDKNFIDRFDQCTVASSDPGSEFNGGQINEFCKYVDRKCILPDGSPSPVLSGMHVSELPVSYLEFCRNDSKKAEKMWNATKKWRIKENIWSIHAFKHNCYEAMKDAYRHHFHGVSKEGYPTTFEQPGTMRVKEFFRAGYSVDDAIRHNIFLTEYICNCIYERSEVARLHSGKQNWGFCAILDMGGFSVKCLSKNVLHYICRVSDINAKNYPLTLKKIFFINSPKWFVGIFNSIKWMIPENNRETSIFLSKDYLPTLLNYFDESQIPKEYGGSSPHAFGQHPFEKDLNDLIALSNEE